MLVDRIYYNTNTEKYYSLISTKIGFKTICLTTGEWEDCPREGKEYIGGAMDMIDHEIKMKKERILTQNN